MKNLTLILVLGLTFSSLSAQCVEGFVKNNENDALVAASLEIISITSDQTLNGTTSEESGFYELCATTPGNYILRVNYLGYKEQLIPFNIAKDGFSTLLDIKMERDTLLIGIPVITYDRTYEEGKVFFRRREFETMAGAYEDPTRLIMKYPGFANSNDQANGIIYNGLGPQYSRWSIDGLEVVNPNHLSNAGTLSDQSSINRGGVSALSGNMMHSYSYRANPDIQNLVNSIAGFSAVETAQNTNRHISLGLLGLEGGWQLGKRSEGPSIMANYRYSFVGLLAATGVDFGGESISFQDLFVSTHFFPERNKHQLNIKYLYANNFNYHAPVDTKIDASSFKDFQDISFDGNIQYVGLNYALRNWDGNHDLKITANFSEKRDRREGLLPERFEDFFPGFFQYNRIQHNLLQFSVSSNYNFGRNNLKYGLYYGVRNQSQVQQNSIFDFKSFEERFNIFKAFISLTHFRYNSFEMNLGGQVLHDRFTEETLLEPHLRVKKYFGPFWYLAATFRINSQSPTMNHLAMRNTNLVVKRTKSQSASVSLAYRKGLGVRMNYNFLYSIPHSKFNFYSGFNETRYEEGIDLSFDGIARTYGFSAYLNREFGKKKTYGLSLNAGIFESEFKSGEMWTQSKYNHRYATNLVLSRNFRLNRSGSWNASLNSSYHFRGGLFQNNINVIESEGTYQTIINYEEPYTSQMQSYSRLDLRFVAEGEMKSKFIHKQIISLDIQNLLNRENDGLLYYDHFTGQIETQNQLGLIPVLSYRLIFH